jgi:prefoldin subunit 5
MTTFNNRNDSQSPLHQQLSEYATLVDRVLKPQLLEAERAAQHVQQEMQDYQELQQTLQDKQQRQEEENDHTDTRSSNNMMVDLGYQTVFCNATIVKPNDTTPSLFVHVGMGFHVAMSVLEAIEFCRKRIHYLQNSKLKPRTEKMTEIQEHIQSATMLLIQLQQEMESGGAVGVGGE